MKKKVIFFIKSHFNQRDYDRFGIEILLDNDFDVQVWDFTQFLTNDAYKKVAPPDPIKWSGCRVFKKKDEAVAAISDLERSSVIVSLLSYDLQGLSIYRAISKNRLFYCTQAFALPISASPLRQRLTKKITNFTLDKLLMRIFLMTPINILGVRPADLVIVVAEKHLPAAAPVSAGTKKLWVHNLDYDLFLKTADVASTVEKNRAVFLDQYLPFHPDSVYSGVKSIINPEEYYGALRRFFDYIEDKYGVDIVIAAHPRANYEDMPDLFGRREVIRGKTVELVRDAGFVIAHNSVAINFAILFRKPILFLTSGKIIACHDLS